MVNVLSEYYNVLSTYHYITLIELHEIKDIIQNKTFLHCFQIKYLVLFFNPCIFRTNILEQFYQRTSLKIDTFTGTTFSS